MKITNQLKPSNQGSHEPGISPSDCDNGTLYVTVSSTGQLVTFPGVAACCYDWGSASCNSCGHNYDQFIGQHLNACGTNNINKCYNYVYCP
jgi:hypothetical protein